MNVNLVIDTASTLHWLDCKKEITHLVSLFVEGIGLEDAHLGIFTKLGVLYAKHVSLLFFLQKNDCF
jgi:hypothetical protein